MALASCKPLLGAVLIDALVILKFALPSELGLRVPAHRVDLINEVPALSIERFDRGPGENRVERGGGERTATQQNLVAAGLEIVGLKPEAAQAGAGV